MQRPRQAVILAGGRGSRLRPITDSLPKPMIPFHGKPFLEYLVELLRSQGFERILLLLGYLPELVRSHFGDGRRWQMQIDTSVSDVEDETGRRLKKAGSKIDPVFLLMYCDNYWPMPFEKMWREFLEKDPAGMLTVYRNGDRYTRDNVRLAEDGKVLTYDKERAASGLSGVDIGFAIFKRQVLDLLPEENVSFERVVYPKLIEKGRLAAFRTGHRYYSVSTPERLILTEQFLKNRSSAVILDRDGVLNKKPSKACYVRSWADWEWLPGAKEALRLFKEVGLKVLLVSNQAGIARGRMTEHDLGEIHEQLKKEVAAAGGEIAAIYHCPHGWEEGCECRKPSPGMLFQAQRDWNLDLSRTPFIGDDDRDGQAADAAGCPWVKVSEEQTLLEATRRILDAKTESCASYRT